MSGDRDNVDLQEKYNQEDGEAKKEAKANRDARKSKKRPKGSKMTHNTPPVESQPEGRNALQELGPEHKQKEQKTNVMRIPYAIIEAYAKRGMASVLPERTSSKVDVERISNAIMEAYAKIGMDSLLDERESSKGDVKRIPYAIIEAYAKRGMDERESSKVDVERISNAILEAYARMSREENEASGSNVVVSGAENKIPTSSGVADEGTSASVEEGTISRQMEAAKKFKFSIKQKTAKRLTTKHQERVEARQLVLKSASGLVSKKGMLNKMGQNKPEKQKLHQRIVQNPGNVVIVKLSQSIIDRYKRKSTTTEALDLGLATGVQSVIMSTESNNNPAGNTSNRGRKSADKRVNLTRVIHGTPKRARKVETSVPSSSLQTNHQNMENAKQIGSKSNVVEALRQVKKEEKKPVAERISMRIIARNYNMSLSTLYRKRQQSKMKQSDLKAPKLKPRRVFSDEQEKSFVGTLANLALTRELTSLDIRREAFQHAETLKLDDKITTWCNSMASVTWFMRFKERHPEIKKFIMGEFPKVKIEPEFMKQE